MQSVNKILFLDLDGVLNPYSANNGLHGDWHKVNIGDIRVWVSLELGNWLNNLMLQYDVKIVWATTWIAYPDQLREYADAIGLALDLDMIPFVEREMTNGTLYASGKLPGIQKYIEESGLDPHNLRMLFVDDDIDGPDVEWFQEYGGACIAPNPGSGLKNKSYRDAIEKFFSYE